MKKKLITMSRVYLVSYVMEEGGVEERGGRDRGSWRGEVRGGMGWGEGVGEVGWRGEGRDGESWRER